MCSPKPATTKQLASRPRHQKSKSQKQSKAGVKNAGFIGPSLPPEPKPEEVALEKVRILSYIFIARQKEWGPF